MMNSVTVVMFTLASTNTFGFTKSNAHHNDHRVHGIFEMHLHERSLEKCVSQGRLFRVLICRRQYLHAPALQLRAMLGSLRRGRLRC